MQNVALGHLFIIATKLCKNFSFGPLFKSMRNLVGKFGAQMISKFQHIVAIDTTLAAEGGFWNIAEWQHESEWKWDYMKVLGYKNFSSSSMNNYSISHLERLFF